MHTGSAFVGSPTAHLTSCLACGMVAKNGAFQQLLRLQQFAAAGAIMPTTLSHLTPATSHLRHFKAVLRELGASAVAGRGPLHAQVRLQA